MVWAFLFLLSAAVFTAIMIFERRTVWSGFFLLLTAFLLGVFLLSFAQANPRWFSEHLLFHILLDAELIFLLIILVAYPLVLIPVFLIGGITLMRREGFRFRNVLSLGMAVALLVFDIFFPLLFDVRTPGTAMYLYWYATLISMYFIVQLVSFGLSNFLNLLHFKKNQGLSYVVVLGCGLSGEKLTPLLRSRVDQGIRVYRNNPGSKLILSGGQGKDELLPESHAMANYAISKGIPVQDVMMEDASGNTEENLRFSARMMQGSRPRFAVATSSYHVMRSLLIARRQKLSCIGYGAGTRLYFSLNAFLREYAGYFRDSRIAGLLNLLLLTVIYLAFVFHQVG